MYYINIIFQDGCVTSILKGLKSQLCTIDCSLKDLQKKTSEVVSILYCKEKKLMMKNVYILPIIQLFMQLLNNEIAKTTFCEREGRLTKHEEEIDYAHTKMQDVLETFLSTKQEEKVTYILDTFTNIYIIV